MVLLCSGMLFHLLPALYLRKYAKQYKRLNKKTAIKYQKQIKTKILHAENENV